MSRVNILSPSYSVLASTFKGAREAFVCVPYFTREGLVNLGKALRSLEAGEFWLSLNVTNWMTGHADFEALAETLQKLEQREAELKLRVKSTLHAKIFYARDRRVAFLSSANLTRAGFGSNVEIGVTVAGPVCNQIDDWIKREARRLRVISLDDLLACIEVTREAVRKAASDVVRSDEEYSPDFNAAVELFEQELMRKLTPSRTGASGRAKSVVKHLRPGQSKLTPRIDNITKLLPRGWPSYEEFRAYLRRKRRDDARELEERADGKYNLQGHVKHFFWASLMFLLENPTVLPRLNLRLLKEKTVNWSDIEWIPEWCRFLDRHDDEHFPELDVSFHTVKVYLPPTLGGISIGGGAGSGNFKRTIVLLAEYLRANA